MTSVNRLVVCLVLCLTAAQSAQAASVYRCNVNGRTVFQQSACASDEAASAPAPTSAPASASARKANKPADPPASGASGSDKTAKTAKPA